METQEALSTIYRAINSSGAIAIALSGSSRNPWIAVVPCAVQDERIKIPVPPAFPLGATRDRFRISFTSNAQENMRTVCGDGIAAVEKSSDGEAIAITPYRLKLFDASNGATIKTILERRRNTWCLQSAGPEAKGTKFWLRAMRTVSFPLSFFPIAIGAGLALVQGRFDWLILVLALVGGMAAHAATNLISDYFDFVNGVDTTNALSSHTGVLVDELIAPDRILMAAMTCFLLTAFCGGILVAQIGWPVLIFGVAGILGGFSYTGGPFAWKYFGLGELSTGLLMGPLMVLGSYFVQMHDISLAAVFISIAIGLLVSAVSWGNNLRDVFFDAQAGVTTLPVKLGGKSALLFFRALIILPYGLIASVILFDRRLWPVASICLTLPRALSILFKMGGAKQSLETLSNRAADRILPLQAIKLHMRFCLLTLVGCAIAALVR
jgi:1,4-dihydroxy-2-naphthoate octaprenyltransferase